MTKKIMLIGKMAAVAAMVIFATSCTKETSDDPQQMLRAGVKRYISASAQLPGTGSDKAYLNSSNGKVLWQLNDEINVNGTAMHEIMLHNDFAAPQAVFEGTVNAMQSQTTSDEIYWAVYPKTLSGLNSTGIPADFQETSLTFTLPAVQNYSTANPTLTGNTYMAAYARVPQGSTDLYFNMKNLGAVVCLKLTAASGVANTHANRIEITTTGGALAGQFTIADDTVTVTPAASATKTLTVNLSDGTNSYIDIATETYIYAYLPPMTGKDLTIKIYNTDGYYTAKTVSSATLARSYMYTSTASNINFSETGIYYSVSATNKVVFSPGNLQWSATGTHNTAEATGVAGTWRFAPNQWDFVGADNENIVNINQSNLPASTYTGWLDLLGWGTSGYHNTSDIHCTHWQPYHYSAITDIEDVNNNLYGYGPSLTMASPDLIGSSAYYDWGIYNDIYNPSTGNTDVHGTWRLLTYSEWDYLVYRRTTASGIRFAKATVNGIGGLLLVPDQWETSIYALTDYNSTASSYSSNIITLADWRILERHGCAFLPGACYRDDNVYKADYATEGYYWFSTHMSEVLAYRAFFSTTSMDDNYMGNRYRGESVRLVKDYAGN